MDIPIRMLSASRSTPEVVAPSNGRGQAPVISRQRNPFNMDKIVHCREKSQSAWLHFPHVELVFLLFAFEGAVAAQVAAVRENVSLVVFILAMSCLVSERAHPI